MIITECTYCDESIWHPYEAGGEGAGGFIKVKCEKCKKNNFIQLVSINGKTYSEEEFTKKFPFVEKIPFKKKK